MPCRRGRTDFPPISRCVSPLRNSFAPAWNRGDAHREAGAPEFLLAARREGGYAGANLEEVGFARGLECATNSCRGADGGGGWRARGGTGGGGGTDVGACGAFGEG